MSGPPRKALITPKFVGTELLVTPRSNVDGLNFQSKMCRALAAARGLSLYRVGAGTASRTASANASGQRRRARRAKSPSERSASVGKGV
jgi:hypothetical protein